MSRNWSTKDLAAVYKQRGVPCPIQDACGDGRRGHKYHAQPVTIDGHRFPSGLEARHYVTLKLAQEQGWITNLVLQPRFVLQEKLKLPSGATQRAIVYVADFQFVRDGVTVTVDVKGVENPVFRMKRKMFTLKYPELTLEVWK